MSRASCSPSRGEKSSAFCASFIAVMITPMRELPQALYRARDVRELDRLAIEQGTSGYELMTRAGAALLRVLRGRWPRARRLTVVCGAGDNGGGGFVVARLAHGAGRAVTVIKPRPPARLHAADIPSGLHADSGRVLGVAVRAHTTVSFIGLKQGLFTGDGPAYCGDIVFDDLGVPASLRNSVSPAALRILDAELIAALPPRPRTALKGDLGHVLVIGGDRGMAGAARLAAEAALRVGAGLVSRATHPDHAAVTTSVVPESMCHAVGDAHTLRPLLTRANVVAIGPGLGQSQWGKTLLDAVLDSGLPLVVDADALNLLARDPLVRTRWVLTPHPGEAARLLACTASEVQAERIAALHALRARYGGVVVLKGAGSLILGDDEVVRVCDAGNPGKARGGMGDVLTGVLAGLAAQGMPLTQSAWLGVHLHARAGDTAALGGQRGLVASVLMPALRQWANPPPRRGRAPAKRPCSPRAPRLRAPARRARRYFISWVISAPARLPWRVVFCAGSVIWARSRARHIPCSSSTTSRAGPSITSTSIASPIRASSMTSAYAIASTVIRCC